MIVEKRVYTLKPGKTGDYLALYRAEGLLVQTKHLGMLIGYYSVDVGTLNQIIHMWGYADMNERAARRAALYADPDWQRVVPKLFAMIERMENSILTPAPFAQPQSSKLLIES
jgi:hypothetical protein